MKFQEGETYEQWCQRVQQFELDRALKKISNGGDPKLVMEEMSNRMIAKFADPIIVFLKRMSTVTDLEVSRESYKKNYIDRFSPKPDHMNDSE